MGAPTTAGLLADGPVGAPRTTLFGPPLPPLPAGPIGMPPLPRGARPLADMAEGLLGI